MPLQPCSNCTAGNHDACEAMASPFCGCRAENHAALQAAQGQTPPAPTTSVLETPDPTPMPPAPEPVTAPMGEVLEAAVRAPQSLPAIPEEGETTLPQSPPVDPSSLLPAPGEDAAANVVAALERITQGEPNDADLGWIAPGQVGLQPLDTSGVVLTPEEHAQLPDAPTAVIEGDAGPGVHTPASPEAGTFIMAGSRPEDAYLSLWDTGRAVVPMDTSELLSPEELAEIPDYIEDPATAALMEAADGAPNDDDTEHAFAGTQEQPYLCACGKDATSLNKLASHLGVMDDDGKAELGKATAAAKMGTLANQYLAPEDAASPAGFSPTIGDEFHAELQSAMQADMPEGESITIEGLPATVTPPFAGAITSEGAGITVETPVANVLGNPTALEPVCIFVDPEHGMVVDEMGQQLPTDLADAILEHYGADPSPIDEDHPPVPGRQVASTPPAAYSGNQTGRSLAGTSGEPVRIQVARHVTDCGRCSERIEPGDLIVALRGVGWAHNTH